MGSFDLPNLNQVQLVPQQAPQLAPARPAGGLPPAMAADSFNVRQPASPYAVPAAFPPGRGVTLIAPGTVVESNASQAPGASFTGKVAKETMDAFARAGGVSVATVSRANGNREVAVWAPPGFDPHRPYEVLLYNRGINGDNAHALTQTHMADALTELNAQGRNVLVVMPKSPGVMNSWFAPPEDAGAVLAESVNGFAKATGMPLGHPAETWLMAHSGGGKSVANILAQPNAPRFDKIMLADSTYGTWAADAAQSLERFPGTQVAAVVTQHNAARAQGQLAARGIRVDAMPARWRFDGHEGVPAYMLSTFVGAQPTKPFSAFRSGAGWGQGSQMAPVQGLPATARPAALTPMVPAEQPGTPIGMGQRGAAVTKLQQALVARGLDTGSVDGIFGPRTRAAVEAFQRTSGLRPTGTADAATQKALTGSLL